MSVKLEKCYARYGTLRSDASGALFWDKAKDWIRPVAIPEEIIINNYLKKPVYRIFANIDLHAPLRQAFKLLIEAGCHTELRTFDGCFNVRWVRGVAGTPSFHSWGIAIDFNSLENPLGGKGAWSNQFIECMIAAGFAYGGDFKNRPDPMHFCLNKIPHGSLA